MNGQEFYPRVDFVLERSVHHFLRDRCNRFGEKVAWVDAVKRVSWTFTEVLRRAEQLRDFILANEVCPSERVALYTFNTIESCASLCALSLIPRTTVLLRSSFNYREAFSCLRISSCSTVITDNEHLPIVLRIQEKLGTIKTILLIGDPIEGFPSISTLLSSPLPAPSVAPEVEEDPALVDHSDDVVFLLPTSGTSGSPKLVAHTHKGFLHTLHVCGSSIRVMSSHETVLLASSLGHAPGLGSFGCVLHVGASLVIIKSGCIRAFEGFRQLCTEYKVNALMVSPSLTMTVLSRSKGESIPSITNIICSGTRPVPGLEQLIRKWFPNVRQLRNMLSLTEAMIFVAITPCDETDLCSVGYPPPFCELRVLDTETGEEVATGEVGEIVMKSPSVMKGYFENAYETQAAHTEDGWLRTGDLGYRDPVSGRFFYVGRTKEVILCLDNRLFPSEVERALLEHPAVADAAVIGVPHRIFGEAPTALVELRQGTQPSAALQQELAALIENQFSFFKRLYGGVFFVEELPRTELNHIARRKLKSLYEQIAPS